MQLMPVLSPQMKKIQEEGEVGRQKMNQWTRYLTVGLCAVQTFFVATWLHRNGIIAGRLVGDGDDRYHAHHRNDLRYVAG